MHSRMDVNGVEAELIRWAQHRLDKYQSGQHELGRDFPYDAVLSCFYARGKHFAPPTVMHALATIRESLRAKAANDPGDALLGRFLAVAMDKWDSAYDYQSYLGLTLLELDPHADGSTGRRQCKEWSGLFLADVWTFEVGARDGTHDLLPQQRPTPAVAEKRLRRITAILSRANPERAVVAADSDASEIAQGILDAAPPWRRQALALSMQPVYVVHDEYLFIRVLQSYEVTFAAMAADMRDAIGAVRRQQPAAAAASIVRCGATLAAARGLFSLLATMRPESFQTFRVYTTGASAIQSGRYKTFEALCSPPPAERLESPAFESVPAIRERIQRTGNDLTSTIQQAIAQERLDTAGLRLIRAAAADLELIHQRWKQTHWKLAVRMIGDSRGTGYTVGVPYLQETLTNRLFRQLCDAEQGSSDVPAR
jgi:tryptophan 2,3-dioxygenase